MQKLCTPLKMRCVTRVSTCSGPKIIHRCDARSRTRTAIATVRVLVSRSVPITDTAEHSDVKDLLLGYVADALFTAWYLLLYSPCHSCTVEMRGIVVFVSVSLSRSSGRQQLLKMKRARATDFLGTLSPVVSLKPR